MSLYRKDGGNVYWSRIMFEGKVYRASLQTTNVKVARQREAVMRTRITNGEFGTVQTPTVRELGVRFLNFLPQRLKPTSYRCYAQRWSAIDGFEPLATAPLNKVDSALIDRLAKHMQEKNNSIATINTTLRVLHRALEMAKKWNLVKTIPQTNTLRGENQRDFVISETDEAAIIRNVEHKTVRVMIPFMIDTGLRVTEACNLKWDDVTDTHIIVREGKTKAACRTIPLTTRAAGIVQELRNSRNGLPHVFTRNWAGANRPMDKNCVSLSFKRAARAAGVSEECVLHSTRHTFCSRGGKKGWSPYVLMKLAGHSDISTSARYCHPDTEQLSKAINDLNGK